MAKKFLGDEIDIHAGGEDLIFPHHENEIAQSEAANGVTFARYWMHNGFLKINNEKMSKSLGNFLTVRDISEKYDLQVLRFFMLGAHYRNPVNFSDELMESAKTGLERIKNCIQNTTELTDKTDSVDLKTEEEKLLIQAEEFVKSFEEAMDDDFNTADAMACVFDLVKFINSNVTSENSRSCIEGLNGILLKLTGVLGLDITDSGKASDEDASWIESLIEERKQAKKDKNFERADEIRDELLSKGIILEDTRDGVRWKRK